MSNVEWPTTATAKAMLRQLDADRERSGYWRSRWAEDHSDQAIEAWLRSLLDWLETAGPVDTPPSARPVELPAGTRSLDAIRTDLATYIDAFNNTEWSREDWLVNVGEAAVGVCESVPQLLAEVEAAHRFEQSVAVEREALLAEVERLREQNDGLYQATLIVGAERDSLRGVVQAVEALAKDPVHECGETCEAWGCDAKGATYYVTLPKLRAALAAAADAPQPADQPTTTKEDQMTTGTEHQLIVSGAYVRCSCGVEFYFPDHAQQYGDHRAAVASGGPVAPSGGPPTPIVNPAARAQR